MSQDGPGQGSDDAGASGQQPWQPPSGAASGGYPQQGTGPGPGPYGGGYPVSPPNHPSASTVLVLGILGLVVCGVLAPFAWIKGNSALAEIDGQPGRWSGRDQVQIGRVLGIVGSVLLGIAVLFLVGMALLFFVSAGAVIGSGSF